MAIPRIEALAMGLAVLNRAFDPDSDGFQLCNWSLARAYSFKHLNSTDDRGRRIFSSVIGGFRFLVQDLEWKCKGVTRAKGEDGRLKPTSTLKDLLLSYKIDNGDSQEANLFSLLDFLARALKDDSITSATTLNFFVENNV